MLAFDPITFRMIHGVCDIRMLNVYSFKFLMFVHRRSQDFCCGLHCTLNNQSTHYTQCLYLECSGWGCNGRAGFPSPPFPSLPLSYRTFPFSPPLEVGPLKSSKGLWGSAVSSYSGVWGGAPADKRFGAL